MQTLGDYFPPPEMNITKKPGRYPEYEFSAFQYWEDRNIHDMKLVKAIIERRIPSSKKVSIDRFVEFAEEYDDAVKAQKDKFGTSAEDTVFSSLQFFTLQTKYSFDYFYELANQMEKLNYTEFPDMYPLLIRYFYVDLQACFLNKIVTSAGKAMYFLV